MASIEAKQRRKRRTPDQWHALLSRFATSGVSMAAFCRSEAISTESFRRWRRQTASGIGAAPFGREPAFIDLGTLPAATPTHVAEPSSSRLELKLDLGGGLTLHLVRG